MLLEETNKQENDRLIASYNTALLDAKSGKSHPIGETLFRTVIEEVLSTVMHEYPNNIMKILLSELIDEDLTTYRIHLQSLHDNMQERFQDVIALNIPNWYSNPIEVDVVDCEDDVQMELMELQNDNDATM
ncbi:Hypothetical predicted protein [Octopus vulgaris]|uniref:Uncharacterized protein n=1 Tax=Octopus vulgaris TaxID=6645 RepID=A0AA36FA38_OCTVU|nr:Hypothetical predicted protein [Octopus vulgaris]